MKRGAKKKMRAREERRKKKEEEERKGEKKNRERKRQKGVGGWWREITRVFVVVCWSSPGYKPFIASLLLQGPGPLLTDR